MSDWADVLGSAFGGGVIAMLVWLGLKQPCPIDDTNLVVECIKVGAVEYSLGQIAFWVPLIATGIGFLIHFARDSR